MAYGPITGRFVAIDSSSTATSGPWLAADFRQITVSFASSGSLGPSRFTIQGSNADGLRASDLGGSTSNAGWSLVSGVNMIGVTPGIVTVDPGFRWVRAFITPALHSAGSYTTIIFHGRT